MESEGSPYAVCFFLILNDKIPASNKKMKATVKNKPFAKNPYTAMIINASPLIFLNFQDKNPKKIASADNQNTADPLSAISCSPNPAPKAVTKNPLANPNNPPKIANTATQIFIVVFTPLCCYFLNDTFLMIVPAIMIGTNKIDKTIHASLLNLIPPR